VRHGHKEVERRRRGRGEIRGRRVKGGQVKEKGK